MGFAATPRRKAMWKGRREIQDGGASVRDMTGEALRLRLHLQPSLNRGRYFLPERAEPKCKKPLASTALDEDDHPTPSLTTTTTLLGRRSSDPDQHPMVRLGGRRVLG